MGHNRYDVVPGNTGWIIRRNALDAGYCADRASALQFAFALARGEYHRHGEIPLVRVLDGPVPGSVNHPAPPVLEIESGS